jgi:hypothetical protein
MSFWTPAKGTHSHVIPKERGATEESLGRNLYAQGTLVARGRPRGFLAAPRNDIPHVPSSQQVDSPTVNLLTANSPLLTGRLRLANEQIQSLTTLDVYGRVARQIMAFAQQNGHATGANGDIVIPLRLTQTDIADWVGASRVHVNKILGVYKRRRYISVDQDYRITVHNPEALARHCIP